jgi:NADPH:quinone reductase-like Zn-dependent oxidoreductase
MPAAGMRAAVVRAPGGPDALTLEDLPAPVPAAGQVVVAVEAAGVNPVDVGNRTDNGWAGIEAPYVVGYELAGTVVDPGDATSDLRPGDPVWGALPVRGTRWGAYAERVAVDASLLARRPEALDAVEAASLPLAGGTALQVLDRLDLDAGDWLLVHGAGGGVGHLMVQLAAARGIRVAAVSGAADQRRVTDLGAELWLDRADGNPPESEAAARIGRDLDAVVDLVGGRLVPAQSFVRTGGALATIVDLEGDFDVAVDRNLSIHGVLLRPGPDLLAALDAAVDAGLRPTVREVFPLAGARAAHERLAAGGVGGRLVLSP